MLLETRNKIVNSHADHIINVVGLKKVLVTDFEACEIWEKEQVIWIPTSLSEEDYFRLLGKVGFYLGKGNDFIDRKTRSWEWALEMTKIGKYRKFYKIISEDMQSLRKSDNQYMKGFLNKVDNKINGSNNY
jgi:hypothetical protein